MVVLGEGQGNKNNNNNGGRTDPGSVVEEGIMMMVMRRWQRKDGKASGGVKFIRLFQM